MPTVERQALAGVLARGGDAAGLVPTWLVDHLADASADGAHASAEGPVDAVNIDRVSRWLIASPWELRKCRSVHSALRTVASVVAKGQLIREVPPPTPPQVASGVRELTNVPRALLCVHRGSGLKLVRLGAVEALAPEEQREAQIRLRLDGTRLRVSVRLSGFPEEAVERALDAAAQIATPLQFAVPFGSRLSAGQVVGRGGRMLQQLQASLTSLLHGGVPAPRRTLAHRDVRGIVLLRLINRTVEVLALVRVVGEAERSQLRGALRAACEAHLASSAEQLREAQRRATERRLERQAEAAAAELLETDIKEMRERKRWRDTRARCGRMARREVSQLSRPRSKLGRKARREEAAKHAYRKMLSLGEVGDDEQSCGTRKDDREATFCVQPSAAYASRKQRRGAARSARGTCKPIIPQSRRARCGRGARRRHQSELGGEAGDDLR